MRLAVLIQPALDDLDAIEIAADRVAQGIDHKAWRRLALRSRRKVAAHRHAFLVPDESRLTVAQIVFVELPAAKEADGHAAAGRAVNLFTLHRVEQGFAVILRRPHCR